MWLLGDDTIRRTFEVSQLMNILIGFGLGVAASWFFWRYLRLMKPKVRISSIVAKGVSRKAPEKTAYRIKIANFGCRQVINLSASWTICELTPVPGGYRSVVKKRLTIPREIIPVLGPKNELDKPSGISPIYVFVTKPKFDVEGIMRKGARMLFTLSATDAMSGTTVVQRKTYTIDQIEAGDFQRGLDFALGAQVSETDVPAGEDAANAL